MSSQAFNTTYDGMRVRDTVHGDILIPGKFLRIVDSREFQRLRRVRQLATAQYAFPGADHTRFAHSLGTFHIMQQIITHFERYFRDLGYPQYIDAHERDLVLAASLLHDLGHTPFSHALEDAMPNAKKIPHEKWTTDLIQDPNGSLKRILEDAFGANSAKDVADLILLQHDESDGPFFPASEVKLRNIFHSLISSQIDADRLDYIRRDSISTGFSYGLIDIDRLISGLCIGILDNGEAVVCVAQDHLSDVEGYLYARYQMYRNIYLSPFKMLTEELLRKIIRCVYELYEHDKLDISAIPRSFKAALQQPAMDSKDFLRLDDYVVMGAVKDWAGLTGKDTRILAELCQCLVERRGFKGYTFVDLEADTLRTFQEDLSNALKAQMRPDLPGEFSGRSTEDWIRAFPFLVLKVERPQLYKMGRDSIYILENSGRLAEISECSGLVRSFVEAGENDRRALVGAIYFNADMLDLYLRQEDIFPQLSAEQISRIKAEVEQMFTSRTARNSIEIEKKYHISAVSSCADWTKLQRELKDLLTDQHYTVETSGNEALSAPVTQTDYYLDDSGDNLFRHHTTLRVRIRKDKAEMTCKKPVDGSASCGGKGQMERYEFARALKNADLSQEGALFRREDAQAFIREYLDGIVECKSLEETICVINERAKYLVRKQTSSDGLPQLEEKYELAFDKVTYKNARNNKSYSEYQVELELKSDPVTRFNMQWLTDLIEKELSRWELETMTDSKYERARRFTS